MVTVCILSWNIWQLIQSESTGSCENQSVHKPEKEKNKSTQQQPKTSNYHIHCESIKTSHYNIAHNFAKCWLIFKSFTDTFTSKFATKSSLTIPPHLNCVTTLFLWNISVQIIAVFKIWVYKASRHAKLSHSKQLLKIPYSHFSVISSLTKRYTEWPY